MGKRRGWITQLRKIFSCQTEKSEKVQRESRKWAAGKQSSGYIEPSETDGAVVSLGSADEQSRHAYSVAIATAAAAEAAVAAANAAAEIVRLTTTTRDLGKSKQELGAIKIQSVFRGYLARRAVKALRGLVRLRNMLGGQSVKRQTANAMKLVETHFRVQYEVRMRRTRMSEVDSALQKQMRQKHEKELDKQRLSVVNNWNVSMQTKEQFDASLQHREEAALRRERSLAYAYSHQQTWRPWNSTDMLSQTFMDPNNLYWGWSWLERWMAARRWENGMASGRELNSDNVSTKTASNPSLSAAGDIRIDSPAGRQQSWGGHGRHSPSTPDSKVPRRLGAPSSRGTSGTDEDSRSIRSFQSEHYRRRSVANSSVKDDESFGSASSAMRGYMASTESARAKSRLPSPLGIEKVVTPSDKSCAGATKKRLSFSGTSPARQRRHSGHPSRSENASAS